jgi:poly-gamma-glutamate synthesis protein (capsule biosynthesis protein)
MLGGRALEALRRMGIAAMARLIWAPLEGADVVVANLEAPITQESQVREEKRYNLKTTREVLDLFDRRFVLGLANNHILDYGERGLLDTIEALDEFGIPHAGAGRNLDEARRPAFVHVRGVSLGVLTAADVRFQAASERSAGVFPARAELLRESIRDLCRKADEVVVSIHAGIEFVPVPSPTQLQLADMCLEEGVRVVSFHHTHCTSGFKQTEKGLVFFGTGNYVFPNNLGAHFAGWNRSAAWKIELPASPQEAPRVFVEPAVLNQDGLPEQVSGFEAQSILQRIQRDSDRLSAGESLRLWRLSEMAKPEYLRLNAIHYVDIARRHGPLRMLQTLWRGVKAQLR